MSVLEKINNARQRVELAHFSLLGGLRNFSLTDLERWMLKRELRNAARELLKVCESIVGEKPEPTHTDHTPPTGGKKDK